MEKQRFGMLVERIEEMRLTAADEAQIAVLLAAAFDTDFGDKSFFQQRQHVRLVARENGVIVGHMGLCFRAVRLGDALVDIVGLGDVATDPAHQGRGIASTLLRAAIAEAKQTRAAFFVLFGNRPIYAGHGFENVAGTVRYIDLGGAKTGAVKQEHHPDLMVLCLGVQGWTTSHVLDLVGHSF